MSFLVRAAALRHLKILNRGICVSAKNNVYNYDDYKPGPYPKTQAEREAAAKKYNLHPLEYEPYPDDGLGSGDYPKLPDVAVEARDPYYPWDEPAHRRNFGEPVHARIDLISEDRWNISLQPRYSLKIMLASFLGAMTLSFALYFLFEPYPMFQPVLAKQLPKPGVTHYTFEPIDASDVRTSTVENEREGEEDEEAASEEN